MKTTVELPDDLLTQAKAVARKRRTTLKAMMEHALRREVHDASPSPDDSKIFTFNEYGFPVLKKTGNTVITNEMIYKIMEGTEDFYLLALAIRHRAGFATLDRRIDPSRMAGGEKAYCVIP